jgi:CheY-like chemotaxis protein
LVFDKPVEEAAESYYTGRARDLIQSVRCTVERNDGQKVSVREWLATPAEHTQYVYEPLAVVLSDMEKRGMVLLEATRRAREAENVVDQLEALFAGTPAAPKARRARKLMSSAREELDALA